MHKKSGSLPVRYHRSLLVKTLAVLMTIFILPMVFLLTMMTQNTTSQMMQDVSSHISISLQNVADTMDEVFGGVEAMANQIKKDTIFNDTSFRIGAAQNPEEYTAFLLHAQISRSLYQYYLSNQYVCSLELYNPYLNSMFINKIGTTRYFEHHPDQSSVKRIKGPDHTHENRWYIEYEDGVQLLTTYFSPSFSNRPTQKLFARIALPASLLEKRVRQLFPGKDAILSIRDESGSLYRIDEANALPAAPVPEEMNTKRNGWFSTRQDGNTLMNVFYPSARTSWVYLVQVPFNNYNSSVSMLTQYFYYFIACLCAILIVSLFFLYRFIIHPLQTISRKFREAEHGDFDVRIHFRQQDEIGYIGHRFNVLLQNTKDLIQENYETRLQKNEFELKYIQTQLNEHFIYNTLDTIHWIANQYAVPEISDIIFKLSHFFRLTLNHGQDIISIADAREILSSYLSLINVRMDHMIQYDIIVEDGLEKEHVIKYPFQPVIENAFQHGIRPKEQGHITVSFTRDDQNRLVFKVEDDGVGMSKDRLDHIRSAVFSTDKTKVEDCFALYSIRQQLELYYPGAYSLDIRSEPNQGTCVTIIFPLERSGSNEKHDHH